MSDITAIDVTGTDSLVLHFSQPVASTFYPLLADQESFMALPTGSASANPNENLVGAGPFMLKSYAQGQSIVLVKNPKYWDSAAYPLGGVDFVEVGTGPQAVSAITSGAVDMISLDPQQYTEVEHDPNIGTAISNGCWPMPQVRRAKSASANMRVADPV